ncbi:MAG TPA: alcohol dehydrogenase [Stellaceae bacterium]|nr:alcohol dehydrogenase [Stellaceae bacterium]
MISYDVTTFGAPLERRERPTPKPAGREVLLRVCAAGVCHSDIHVWHGWYDLGDGQRLTLADRGVSLPLTLGHEIVARVVALGDEAEGVTVGQAYLVYPWIGCGHCTRCGQGREHLCPAPRFLGVFAPGGYSDHLVVPDPKYLLEIGDIAPERAASYACSGLTTFSAMRKIDPLVLRTEPIVIIGAGGLGLMCLSLLKLMGGAGAVVIETSPARRQAALDAGALQAIDPAAPDAAALVAQAIGGGAAAIIDYVGSGETVTLAIKLLDKAGQLIVVGLFGGEIRLSTPMLPIRALTIQGSYIGSLDELRELVALVRDKRPAPIPIACCDLQDAASALARLEAGQVVGRLVLLPPDEPSSARF